MERRGGRFPAAFDSEDWQEATVRVDCIYTYNFCVICANNSTGKQVLIKIHPYPYPTR